MVSKKIIDKSRIKMQKFQVPKYLQQQISSYSVEKRKNNKQNPSLSNLGMLKCNVFNINLTKLGQSDVKGGKYFFLSSL